MPANSKIDPTRRTTPTVLRGSHLSGWLSKHCFKPPNKVWYVKRDVWPC